MFSTAWRELNAAERDVLLTLLAQGPSTGREIMATCERPEITVSRAVRSLADDGLVDRTEDGRQIENALTDKGRAVIVAAANSYREAI